MKLLAPMGLLALLGIPVLLVLFFLRNRYQQRALSSTFIWRLSQRHLQKYQLSRQLIRYLLLLFQVLIISLAALILAQPRLINRAENSEYIAILDTSASMRQEDENGVSRFDVAREEILSRIRSLGINGRATVITTTSATNLVMERSKSVSDAERLLGQLTCGYGSMDLNNALKTAQEILDEAPEAQVCFYTDHDYPVAENVMIHNVAAGREEWNSALTEISGSFSNDGATLVHQAVSYGRDAELTLALYVNGRLASAQIVSCPENEAVDVVWHIAGGTTLQYARVLIDAADGIAEDNEVSFFRPPAESLQIQLVSGQPFYWETSLSAFPQVTVTSVPGLGVAQSEGYDLYIYDGVSPDVLPDDGAVLLADVETLPAELALETGDVLRGTYLSQPKRFANQGNRPLIAGVTVSRIAVQKFREMQSNDRYTPVLLCGEMPVLLAGHRDNGTACMALAFDLHDSNLPLLPEMVTLMKNLLAYVMPDMMTDFAYSVGETVVANALPLCEQILLQPPDGQSRSLEIGDGTVRYQPQTPGVYTLFQDRSMGSRKYCRFFVGIPEAESDISAEAEARWVYLSPAEGTEASRGMEDGFDPTLYLALLMLLLLCAECVVYRHVYF